MAASANPANCGYGNIRGENELRQVYAGYISTLYQHKISTNQTHITAVGVLPLPGDFFGSKQEQYLRIAFANAGQQTLHLLTDRLQALPNSYE